MTIERMGTKEAGPYIGLKPSTLEKWRCERRGPTYSKIGKRVIYDRADLDAFVVACKVEPGASVTEL